MTRNGFYAANFHTMPELQQYDLKNDIIVSRPESVEARYYGTLIARLEGDVLELYAVGYSKSTTARHNFLRRLAEVNGWTVKEAE